jgi:hypothetical protein
VDRDLAVASVLLLVLRQVLHQSCGRDDPRLAAPLSPATSYSCLRGPRPWV